jgi:ABC-type branched-subunit amino acid transport system permease subunit
MALEGRQRRSRQCLLGWGEAGQALTLLRIPEVLRIRNVLDATAFAIRLMVYGLMLVLSTHFRPRGLAGDLELN